MNTQIQINGQNHNTKAYRANEDLILQVSGVQMQLAPDFSELFTGMPDDRASSGFLEVGEWQGGAYPFETQIELLLGPDGGVWAKVCPCPDELPLIQGSNWVRNEQLAARILKEAEEAFAIKSTIEQRVAGENWPAPISISDYLFWIEGEARMQDAQERKQPNGKANGSAYSRALRNLSKELRALGFQPSPPQEWDAAQSDAVMVRP